MTAPICPIHNIPYKRFTKGDSEWYSHKNEDGSWCNMSKDAPKPPAPPKPQPTPQPSPQPPQPISSPVKTESRVMDRDASIEAQVAFKGLIELMANKVIEKDSLVGKAVILWALNKMDIKISEVKSQPKA